MRARGKAQRLLILSVARGDGVLRKDMSTPSQGPSLRPPKPLSVDFLQCDSYEDE